MPPTDKQNTTCDWVREHVDEFVDGLLGEEQQVALLTHCEACAECAYELELAKTVREGLKDLPLLSCPDEVTDLVFQNISEQSAAEVRSTPVWLAVIRPLWRPISVAAAVAAVVLMTFLVNVDRNQSTGQATQAEIDQALREAKFALAVISDVGRETGRQVGDDVQTAVVDPVRQILNEETEGIGL